MDLYKGMDAQTLEAEYNLVARRGPDFSALVERWLQRGESHRATSKARVDLAYGDGEREKLDLFSGGNSQGPLLVYIHGGYWQRGDKSMYSFVSEALMQHGVSVAVLNYNLTPSVRIGEIAPQIRKAIAWCWHNADDLGFARDKMFVMGHSAGGHLTAIMMATDWPAFDEALPADLVKAGIPISGVFELEPLVHTSLNEGPQMDIAEARRESPCFIPPITDAPQLVVVGGAETAEFLRQSDDYASQYSSAVRKIERYDVPAADHFDELERLAEDDSIFFKKSLQLIEQNS
ncbi:MAG: arylformamidase [Planctomycetota bacterium]|jgi:arylformamidase